MWLNAYRASTHYVYFGTNQATVAAATPTSPEYREKITGDGNVYYLPGSLQPGSSYYWRVDAEIKDKTTYKGDVWSFQTQWRGTVEDRRNGEKMVSMNDITF